MDQFQLAREYIYYLIDRYTRAGMSNINTRYNDLVFGGASARQNDLYLKAALTNNPSFEEWCTPRTNPFMPDVYFRFGRQFPLPQS